MNSASWVDGSGDVAARPLEAGDAKCDRMVADVIVAVAALAASAAGVLPGVRKAKHGTPP